MPYVFLCVHFVVVVCSYSIIILFSSSIIINFITHTTNTYTDLARSCEAAIVELDSLKTA